jgi:hypothetical protein
LPTPGNQQQLLQKQLPDPAFTRDDPAKKTGVTQITDPDFPKHNDPAFTWTRRYLHAIMSGMDLAPPIPIPMPVPGKHGDETLGDGTFAAHLIRSGKTVDATHTAQARFAGGDD